MTDLQTRSEKDSLGEIDVPDEAHYGASTQRAVENFPISGQTLPIEFIYVLVTIKKCAAQVNGELSLLEEKHVQAITDSCDEILIGNHDDQFPVDVYQTGSGTSTHMNVNEVIAHLANDKLGEHGIHANDHVNRGQSSNDVFPTAIHIAVAANLQQKLIPALTELKAAYEQKATELSEVIKVGRTHLMDATPVTLGQVFAGYGAQIGDAIEAIEGDLPSLRKLPIGGTAVGTGINTHPEFGKRMCQKLSDVYCETLEEVPNHFAAQGSRDACVQTSGNLRSLAITLSKITNDIRWMSSGPRAGLNEITLPPLQPGSSIMPGKVNPVMCECLMQACARIIGNDATVAAAGQLGNFELNTGMPLICHSLLQSINILSNAITAFTQKCIVGIEANREKLSDQVEQTLMLATKLTPAIGYDRAADVAKRALEYGRTVRDVAQEEGLSDAQIEELLDPGSMLSPEEGK